MILWVEIVATTTYLENKNPNNHLKDAIYSKSMEWKKTKHGTLAKATKNI
jgi:hypothetical protein